MKILFDTSVVIASLLRDHPFHEPADRWLACARRGQVDLILSAHTVAETYASMTAMPLNRRAPTADLQALIDEGVLTFAKRKSVPARPYPKLVRSLAAAGIRGGAVYDAIIAEVARREDVDLLLTLNLQHFLRVWPEGANRIRSPADVTPVPRT